MAAPPGPPGPAEPTVLALGRILRGRQQRESPWAISGRSCGPPTAVRTWTAQASRISAVFCSGCGAVVHADADHRKCGGQPSLILRTTDRGATWRYRNPVLSRTCSWRLLHRLEHRNRGGRQRASCGPSITTILRTTDGGATWRSQPTGLNRALLRRLLHRREHRMGGRRSRHDPAHHYRRRAAGDVGHPTNNRKGEIDMISESWSTRLRRDGCQPKPSWSERATRTSISPPCRPPSIGAAPSF